MNAVPSRLPLRFGRACSKAAMVLVTLLLVGVSPAVQAQALSLINGESTQKVALGDLRDRADTAFTVFDPFQGRDVDMRGISFRDFLIEHFGEVPPTLHFTAWDDYEVSLGGWDDPSWYLVTIEDGEPLSLRSRGPIRLVEREYSGRDIENLRDFNDWIWMIRSIEAQW
ncbi:MULTISPECIES: hypothetical protein [Halomonadaceae]|nr:MULTISPECIES: hypothetical protein [Halomonas]MCG7575450.1 hypothetical protein [Halomonas sp. MMH1-48]MCG7588937.1 hypothetical protein [Halomonas sp. McD50-5]MCG7602512.1 hypothetical protein [Halomonas sp. MM17-34]MCG7611730.1 hypothetical protein [Halomonas sp. MM17-29]MCG7615098.1 hypothetical protein [Halomonas sp. McD50-4]